jgi:tRNA/rRNA methyltransferase
MIAPALRAALTAVFSIGCIGTGLLKKRGGAQQFCAVRLAGILKRSWNSLLVPLAIADRVRFVLVAPSHPGNIGAAARALKTMGWHHLAVVAPKVADFRTHEAAVAFASNAQDVLQGVATHASLAGALRGVRQAFAMTGYAREFGPRLVDLRTAVVESRDALAEPGDVAFVFGTERDGLRNEDVERCQACCAIPADADYGSLNLAQAVQVVAYECRLAIGKAGEVASRFGDDPPAAVESVEAMYRHLEQALVSLGYLDPAQPRRLMSRLRRLITRAQPSAKEIDILRGIAAAIIERKSERVGRKNAR